MLCGRGIKKYGVQPTTSLLATNITRTRTTTCYAGIQVNTNGTEYITGFTGSSGYTINNGTWLDTGTVDQVWIESTVNSGSLFVDDASSGRVALTTTRAFQIRDTTSTGGANTANITLDLYDASSGGNLLQTITVALSAEYQDLP